MGRTSLGSGAMGSLVSIVAVLAIAGCSSSPSGSAPATAGRGNGGGNSGNGGTGGNTGNGPVFTGSAKASVTVGSTKLDFPSGKCDIGPDDSSLAINSGSPLASDADYFGLLAGTYQGANAGARSTKGGDTFTGNDVVITFRKGSTSYLLRDKTLILAADVRSGTFTATDTLSKSAVSGQFSC